MTRRLAGAVWASALTSALLASSWGVASAAAGLQIDEETCFGEEPTVTLESGEPYTGTAGIADVILGGGSVNGGDGDDLICDAAYVLGGDGDDRIRMLGGGTARGNAGDDEFVSITVDADVAGPVLDGGAGNDIFWGGTQGETIYAGAGVDVGVGRRWQRRGVARQRQRQGLRAAGQRHVLRHDRRRLRRRWPGHRHGRGRPRS